MYSYVQTGVEREREPTRQKSPCVPCTPGGCHWLMLPDERRLPRTSRHQFIIQSIWPSTKGAVPQSVPLSYLSTPPLSEPRLSGPAARASLLTTPLTAAQGAGNLLIISTQPPIPSPWAVDSLCLCSLACFLPSVLSSSRLVFPHPVFLVLTHNKLFLHPIPPSKCVRSSASTVRRRLSFGTPPAQQRPPPPLVHAFCSLPAPHTATSVPPLTPPSMTASRVHVARRTQANSRC